MQASAVAARPVESKLYHKVGFASFIGTAIQWYDFFIYNVAAYHFFPTAFFPGDKPGTALLKSLAIYTTGFAARPLGGLVCGHFGDRIGRKSMLVMTLLITGIATFSIGLLPEYKHIGIWAPILLVLLRVAQGFAVGGEWAGATLMAVEHAPGSRRGFYGSWPQMGAPVGLFLSNVVFGLVLMLPAEEPYLTWGWRVPFLLSVVLVVVGLYIRMSVPETPPFREIESTASKEPLHDAWRQHRKNVLLGMGARLAENGAFYIYTAFILGFALNESARKDFQLYERTSIVYSISIAALFAVVAIPIYGLVSDRLGRKPVYLFGAIFTALFAFPFFWLINSGQPMLMTVAVVCALVFGHSAMYAPQGSFFPELFGTRVRFSGASLASQIAAIFAGGLSPLIAEGLMRWANSTWPVALYLVGMAAVTIVSVSLIAETAHKDIS